MSHAERQGPASKLGKLCLIIRCGPLKDSAASIVGSDALPVEFMPTGTLIHIGEECEWLRLTEPGYRCRVAGEGADEWAIPDRMLIPKHDPDPEQHADQDVEVSA